MPFLRITVVLHMADALDHIPHDNDALKTPLIEARARLSDTEALIEHFLMTNTELVGSYDDIHWVSGSVKPLHRL